MSVSYERLNSIGEISHFFAVRKPLSLLVLIAVLLFGFMSFWLTPKQYNPEITRPAFAITLAYTGATTAEAADRVVYELVEKVGTVPGVDDIYTEVTDGAAITTTVIFEVGYDAVRAKLDLLSQLQQHSYLARGLIGEPQVIEINPETIPVMQIAFGSDRLSVTEVRRAVVDISHQLQIVEGVSEVNVTGGFTPALVVEVDPEKLAASGVTLSAVRAALNAGQTRLVSSGFNSDTRAPSFTLDARVDGPDSIGALVVTGTVRVRDVATLFEGTAGDRSYVLYETAQGARGEVVMLSVAKVEGSSAPVVTGATRDLLTSLVATSYPELSFHIVGDDGVTASHEIGGLTTNLLQSIAIVSIVLLLFLSFRAALVVLVTIPVTLLIVFGLGYFFDQTINRITLFALILSLGLLVDSAIVVVENIFSHLQRAKQEPTGLARERIIAGAVHEIGIGLLLSTVTSIIVFLPMNYISGMMGPYMGPIAFFVPAALFVSLIVAITITPFLATYLLDAHETPSRLSRWFGSWMCRLGALHQRFLRSVLYSRTKQRRLLLGALFLFVVTLILPLSGLVHFQMLPKADRDQLYVYLDLPEDTAVEETRRVSETLTTAFLTQSEVLSTQSFVATPPILDFNGMFKGAQVRTREYQATIRVNLTAAADRRQSSTEVTAMLRELVVRDLPDVVPYLRFIEEPPGPPVRSTLVATLAGADAATRAAAAAELYGLLDITDGVVDPYMAIEKPVPRVRYSVNHAAADVYGVSVAAIVEMVDLLGQPQPIGEYQSAAGNEYTPMLLSVAPDRRSNARSIDSLTVIGSEGQSVPLSALVTTSYEELPPHVDFESVEPVTYVTAEVEGRSIVYVVIELMHRIINGDLPGYAVEHWNLFGLDLRAPDGTTFSLAWDGEWKMTLENFRDLGIAMGVALVLVYGVLVAQYNRFATPAYILVTVPLGLVGILWGFLILDGGFGIYLTATALIGFIALIGLVVNNAIIYLEYVEQATAAGRSYRDALLAAGEARLQPILLTSLTTVLGSLTIASDPVWSGLAWSIVFGLSLSTLLTLVVYPTLLVYFSDEARIN